MHDEDGHAERLGFLAGSAVMALAFVLAMPAADPIHATPQVAAVLVVVLFASMLAAHTSSAPLVVIGVAAALAAVQTTAVGVWAPEHFPMKPAALALIESKTLFLLGGTVFLLPALVRRLRETAEVDLWRLAAVIAVIPGWSVVTVAWGGWQGQATLAYGRNFATPTLLVLLLLAAMLLNKGVYLLSGFLASIAAALTFGSVAQIALGHANFSDIINIEQLMAVKGPISSYTDFLGVIVPRLRSFVGEPINASYTFAALTWWAVVRRHWWLVPILAAQNVLTFAKGGMLMSVSVLLWLVALRVIKDKSWFFTALLLSSVVGPLYVLYVSLSSSTSPQLLLIDPLSVSHGQNSAFTHAAGLVLGLQRSVTNPLGAGLGSGGNFGDIFTTGVSHEDWIQSGAESAIAVLAVQLGLIALIALLLTVRRLLGVMQRLEPSIGPRVGAGLFVGWLFSSLFQENAWGPQAAIPVFTVITFCLLNATRQGSTSESAVRL